MKIARFKQQLVSILVLLSVVFTASCVHRGGGASRSGSGIYQNPNFPSSSDRYSASKKQIETPEAPAPRSVPEALVIPEPPSLSLEGGTIQAEKVKEASGMIRSAFREDVLWVINDDEKNNRGRLYAVGSDGSNLGSFFLTGSHTRDWEDLASFQWKGLAHLLVGDIGDNQGIRSSGTLYVVREPKVIPGRKISPQQKIAWRVRFRFEDGARDCEALAVDPQSGVAYLISKRKKEVGVYQLDISPTDVNSWRVARVAKRVATMASAPAGYESLDDFSSLMRNMALGNQVTALDFSPNGEQAAVLTYSRILLFDKAGKSWERAFLDTPRAIAYPPLYQAESLCFSQDGSALYVCSEGGLSPLYRVEIP